MRNKSKVAATIIMVLLTTSAALMLSQSSIKSAQAQLSTTQQTISVPAGATPEITYDTRAYLSLRPNPIGVGQDVLINTWINPCLHTVRYLLSDITGCYKLTITKPDGTTQVVTMRSTFSEASSWHTFVPDVVGEWKIKFEFLGTYFPAGRWLNGYLVTNTSGTYLNSTYYKPSSAPEETLTVQADMVWSWPPAPLPTDYWTRPVSLSNREWWPILGNYPGTGYVGGGYVWDELYPNTNPYDGTGRYNFHPWVQGPNSEHVVWKRQGASAGLIGGSAGQYGMTSSPGNPSLVYNGRCYQTVTKVMTVLINGTYRQQPVSVAECYDLRTGGIYYDIPTGDGGVTPTLISYNAPGGTGMMASSSTWSVDLMTISSGRLYKINTWTGAVTLNASISPLTTGTYYMNQYALTVQDLGVNATSKPGGRYRLINWTTAGTSTTLTSRIASNITWPWINLPGEYVSMVGTCVADFNAGIAAFVSRSEDAGGTVSVTNVTAVSLTTGQLLWNKFVPDDGTYSASCIVADHGKVAFLTQKGYFLAYDLATGAQAWKSETMDYPWGATSFGAYAIQSAYGMFFRQSYDGVYAFDWETGKVVWKYTAPASASFESPYTTDGQEHYSFNGGAMIADGKMYVYNTEHTETWPLTRGWGLHCINITTGEGVWTIANPMVQGAIADGYLTAANSRDGYMYVFGKGKTATTVTAPNVEVPLGTSVLVTGSVMDMSPAQPGTPCVSKDSMQTQMEYLHLQQPIAGIWGNETITGVPVKLTAIDQSGVVTDLGTAVTNGYTGVFSLAWTPPAEGKYEILASFGPDESYGSSSSSTALLVGPAPETSDNSNPQIVSVPDYTMTIIGAAIAMIIAVAIATILILRKRP